MMPVDNDREETPLRSTNSPATSICNNSELPLFLPRTPTTPFGNLELQDTATDPTEDEIVLRSTNSPATSICNNSELPLFLPRTPTTPFGNLELQDSATDPTEDEIVLRYMNSPATSICNNSELLVSLPRTPTTPVENLELQDTATDPTEDEIVEKLEKLKGNFTEASEYLQSIGWTITATPRRKNRTKMGYIFFSKKRQRMFSILYQR
jgi:hypothetical protein